MAFSRKKSDNLNVLREIYHESQPKNQPRLPFREKIKQYFQDGKKVDQLLSGAIIFFGLAAIGLGFFQFKANLTKYFLPKLSEKDVNLGESGVQKPDLLGLSQKDTDQDGLSDYDELNIYQTSPYLPDSDSDGISDEKEIASGSDPNCVLGQNCFVPQQSFFGSQTGFDADLLIDQPKQTLRLRQALQQAGMSAAELNQLSDEQLFAAYQEVLKQNQKVSQATTTVSLSAQEIENLTPLELRQLLNLAGVAWDILNNISDQELLELVDEILVKENQ